jgi:hypothetical protein
VSEPNAPELAELIKPPHWRSRLHIHRGTCFMFNTPPPCTWWRFWQRVLLGWRWEKV